MKSARKTKVSGSPLRSWKCPKCKKSGRPKFDKNESVMNIVSCVLDAHEKLSPKCDPDNVVFNWSRLQ